MLKGGYSKDQSQLQGPADMIGCLKERVCMVCIYMEKMGNEACRGRNYSRNLTNYLKGALEWS